MCLTKIVPINNYRVVLQCAFGLLLFLTINHHLSAATVFDNFSAPVIGNFWGGDTAEQRLAQQFLLDDNNTVTGVNLELVRAGSPSGLIDIEIWNDSGSGTPGTSVGTIGSIDDVRSVPTIPTLLTFDDPIGSLTPDSPYYVVISFLEATGDGFSNISWNVVEEATGTHGAQQAQATPVGSTDWVRIVDIPPAPVLTAFYKMSVTAARVVPGDYDGNGVLDAADIDALSAEVRTGTNLGMFDLNADSLVNQEDRRVWVDELRKTYFGDSDLNGEFNSRDLVSIFQAGQYEDSAAGNSIWTTGDWDGNGDFESGDFVLAFQAGGYEKGPRVAVAAVPEPSSLGTIFIAIGALASFRGRRKWQRGIGFQPVGHPEVGNNDDRLKGT